MCVKNLYAFLASFRKFNHGELPCIGFKKKRRKWGPKLRNFLATYVRSSLWLEKKRFKGLFYIGELHSSLNFHLKILYSLKFHLGDIKNLTSEIWISVAHFHLLFIFNFLMSAYNLLWVVLAFPRPWPHFEKTTLP